RPPRSGWQIGQNDSGAECSAHQSPFDWKTAISFELQPVQTAFKSRCSGHRSEGTSCADTAATPEVRVGEAPSARAAPEDRGASSLESAHPSAPASSTATAHPPEERMSGRRETRFGDAGLMSWP